MNGEANVFFSHGNNHSRGVAILIADRFELKINKIDSLNDGRTLLLDVEIKDCNVILVNVYAPTGKKTKRERFFMKMNKWLSLFDTAKDRPYFILGGDFNCVLDNKKDVQGTQSSYYKTPQNLNQLCKQRKLIDIWRHTHVNTKQFTWRNMSLKVASRLDYWLVSKWIQGKILSNDIRPCFKADHNAISLKLTTSNILKGPGFWKMNTEILKDHLYKEKIKLLIKNVIDKTNLSPMHTWEYIKIKVREFTERYCKNKASKKRNTKLLLEKRLTELQKKIDANIDDLDAQRDCVSVIKDLEQIYKRECKGAAVRARVRWLEKGEKCTNYFLGLEKYNSSRKEINQLFSGNKDKCCTKQKEILQEVVNFYSLLYKRSSNDVHEKKVILIQFRFLD